MTLPRVRCAPMRHLSDRDRWLFAGGAADEAHDFLGCHLDEDGATFRVWAPNAREVSVLHDANGWTAGEDVLHGSDSGIWEGRIEGFPHGTRYKYAVRHDAGTSEKADPFGFWSEAPPGNASIAWDLSFDWSDDQWMASRGDRLGHHAPVSIYELHLGSWLRDGVARYRDVADGLIEHLHRTGFTHVEFLPLMEHPFYGSWGYQGTGYFAPTSRYGTPQDLMYLVDRLHGAGIGVVMDWVPSHFPTDAHGLGEFDGTHLYEHADPRKGFHPDWGSHIFNYDRNEVRSFLRSSAHFWVQKYHVDALRVDAVASMLYLDYSRDDGEWIPNEYGGNENLGAISLLRELNVSLRDRHPGVHTIAEESTAWPGVTAHPSRGGLGFSYKWDMGWMHDTLGYLGREPVHRAHHHDELTFRSMYAHSEDYVLSISHDEVVHGKASLLGKMAGDRWQQFANLRLLFTYQWTTPGKKLIFMGSEIADPDEWNHDIGLPWNLLEFDEHAGIERLVGDLNEMYRHRPALHRGDSDPAGFRWVTADDSAQSVLSYLRIDPSGEAPDVLVALNFTPVPRLEHRLGVPHGGRWVEVVSTDAERYGGTGVGNLGGVDADDIPSHGFGHSVCLALPPLGAVVLEHVRGEV